jgi:hypothetical protein
MYTKEIHQTQLSKMRHGQCPATDWLYSPDGGNGFFPGSMWHPRAVDVCNVCREFVGLEPLSRRQDVFYVGRCPCNDLGVEEAMGRTRTVLGRRL